MTTTTNDLFAPAPVTRFHVAGSYNTFPVRRVYCIGRNYAAHAVEMGHDPDKEPPFFFQKSPDNIVFGDFPYPTETSDVHHEIELVVALHKGGRDIPVEKALEHVYGYGVGLDMTRRDLAQGQWRDPAGGRSEPDALESAGNDLDPVALL